MSAETPILGRTKVEQSPLRNVTATVMRSVAEGIHSNFPKTTPNHVSLGSFVAGVVGEGMVAIENRKSERNMRNVVLGTGLAVARDGLDGVDGALARYINYLKPGTINTLFGDFFDSLIDRSGEVVGADIRAATARKNGKKWGERAARAVELTTVLPSFVKYHKKSKGKVIHEVGKNAVAVLGSRPGRAILDYTMSIFPNAQPHLDTVGAFANIYSAINRLKSKGRDGYSPEQRKYAAYSMAALAGLEVVAIARTINSLTPAQLQDLQRSFAPSKKWREKQPDHRDALRHLKSIIDGEEHQISERVQKKYPGIDENATRILDARENQIYKDKVGVVTGATGAIGEALAEQLALMGMEVVICARDTEKAEVLATKITEKTGNSKITVQQIDLQDQESIVRAVGNIDINHPGGIDFLFNGAGVTPAESKEREVTMEEWIGVNYLGPSILTLGLIPHMRKDGQVINLTSSSQNGNTEDFAKDIFPEKSKDPYHGAKLLLETVMNGMEAVLAEDPRDIIVRSIHPGNVHKTLEGKTITSRLSRSKRLKSLLSTPGEAALGVVRVLLTAEGGNRYVYGKQADYPEAAKDKGFQKNVINATAGHLDDQAVELVGTYLQSLTAK